MAAAHQVAIAPPAGVRLGQDGSSFCFLFGTTHAFSADQLEAFYQHHGTFVSAWRAATKSAQRAGFLVDADAKELISAAVHSDIAK